MGGNAINQEQSQATRGSERKGLTSTWRQSNGLGRIPREDTPYSWGPNNERENRVRYWVVKKYPEPSEKGSQIPAEQETGSTHTLGWSGAAGMLTL